MDRDEIRLLMVHRGFKFEKTTKAYPSRRGVDDVYSMRPEFKYSFRISLVSPSRDDYGLYAGVGTQYETLCKRVTPDIDVSHEWRKDGTPLPMWTGKNLRRLLDTF